MTKQFLKSKTPMVRSFTICSLIIIMTILLCHMMLIRSFFNFSSHVLTDQDKSFLSKGLNFAIPAKDINYADYMLPFELFYRDINSLRFLILIWIALRPGYEIPHFHHTRKLVNLWKITYLKLNLMLLDP